MSKKATSQGDRKSTKRATAQQPATDQPTAAASTDSGIRYVNLTVRLPYDPAIGTDERRDVLPRIEVAEDYAQLLEHPDCPDTFKQAFETLFVDGLLNLWGESIITEPTVVRVLLPFVLNELDRSEPATADGIMQSLAHLRGRFANKQYEEILARQKEGK